MYQNITLEMSLKPFKKTDDDYIKNVCYTAFEQWKPLIKKASVISILLWTADGSELLDYKGKEDDSFEWAYWIGGANNREGDTSAIDPDGIGLHSTNYLYMDNPPTMTYAILKKIVQTIKQTGKAMFPGKDIHVGTTFDPGPEFAKSSFKYERHEEICTGSDMGHKTFVCSYAVLHADNESYAAYPDGIPEGTPFGTFLGKQANVFLKDMGFDYIWLSNGLGFGREPWSTKGAIFDGEDFNYNELDRIKKNAIDFWKYFRAGCPDYPIEVRGTNMSMGIDLATDGIPLKDIYDGDYNLLPPPNSPWAALNFDFGLELMGYMSRIAYLPDEKFLFRYYIHDPWWVNSPWYDRYNQMPHDIYLPMSIGKIDKNGKLLSPTNLNLLSIDNSYGNMPDSCANETIPHLLKAEKETPDSPSPVVWVYPFDEYSNCADKQDLNEMFSEDWFIRGAINNALPLSSVTSTTDFTVQDKQIYKASVLVSPVPKAESSFETSIIEYVNKGGKVIFYGNTKKASQRFLKLIGIKNTDEISGTFDVIIDSKNCGTLNHRELVSGGGLNTVVTDGECIAECGGRAIFVRKGTAIWLRGSVSASYNGGQLLVPDDANEFFISETLILKALDLFGISIKFENPEKTKAPVIMIHKHNNAFIFSCYSASTTVKTKLRFPYGMPILDGYESRISDGFSEYNFPKAEHKECRVFVEQENGIVGCHEIPPVSYQMRRRILVHGLKNATVRFLAENYCKNNIEAVLNSHTDFYCVSDDFEGGYVTIDGLTFYEAKNVTGELVLSMPTK